MTAHKSFGLALLAASSPLALATAPAAAQTRTPEPPPTTQGAATNPDDPLVDEESAIVVTGQRQRGAVVGDVKPLQQLDAGDIRALGVSNINDLLTELGPQVQSASGRPPVMLLEGRRMSSPMELASLPSEAIQRVDVLPEEVGLRYGYGADQKVLNIVLRERFRAVTGEVNARLPTSGEGNSGTAEVTFLSIRNGKRFNLGAELRGQASVLESDRGLTDTDSPYRTLLPFDRQLTINSTYKTSLAERMSATLTGQIVTDQNEALIGRSLNSVALERATNKLTTKAGFVVARDHAKGQITLTGNYDHAFSRQLSEQATGPFDTSVSYTDTASLDLLYNTSLVRLPSGDISLTTHLSGSSATFRSVRERGATTTPSRVRRDIGGGSVNLSIPIAGMGTPLSRTIGTLSANFNASLDETSDAGQVHSYGVGVNWQPIKIVSVTGNFTKRTTAPTAQQLGDAQVETINVPIFNYANGTTVNVKTISGGNPNLANAEVQSFRLGLSVSPLKDPQLNFQVDLSQNRTTGGIASLPGVTADTLSAFPSRFTFDDDGILTQVDMRPINIGRQKSTQLRWGFNFNMQLKTPQSQIRAFQEVARRRMEERLASGQLPPEVAARMRQALAQGGQAQGGQAQGGQAQGGQAQGGAGTGQQPDAQQGDIVVQGNPNAAGGAPGGFAFGGPGGNFTPPPGGFRGPPGGGGFGGPGGFGPGGFGGPGGFRGGGGDGARGGRLNFSVYHTYLLDSTAQLAPGLPIIDQLNGGTLGGGASPSRHQVQLQAGYTQGGLGFRTFSNWNAATRSIGMSGTPSSNLRFGSLTTVNFRIFVNFQQLPKLVEQVPFLRGSRLTFGANNLFDARQKVTDGNGLTPYAYQGAFLDRTGRSVSVSFRKLFF